VRGLHWAAPLRSHRWEVAAFPGGETKKTARLSWLMEDVGGSEDPRAAAHWGPCKLRCFSAGRGFRWGGFFFFREVFPLISLSAAIGLAGDGVSTTGSSAQYTSPALP
jgi:hypothetical protein